jgi:hypothetical protein
MKFLISITPWLCFTPQGKDPQVPTGKKAGWAPQPVSMQKLEEKSSAPAVDSTPVILHTVSHY